MKKTYNIGQALFPKIKRKILTLFLSGPENKWTITEVIKHTGNSSGAVQRELKRLVNADILLIETMGRRKLYSANSECMIYPELRQIIVKTFGVTDILKNTLEPLNESIDVAFVFGSVASNKDSGTSDIDVLVVGEVTLRELIASLKTSEDTLMRVVNPTIYSPQEFRNKAIHGNHFLTSVLESQKLFLVGGPDDIEKLARKQMD